MPVVAVIAVVAAGSATTALIGGIVTFGLATGVVASVVGGIVIGAVVGGVSAAITGDDIVDGMKSGAIAGGIAGGLGAWGAEAGAGGEVAAGEGMSLAQPVAEGGAANAHGIVSGNLTGVDLTAYTGEQAVSAGVQNVGNLGSHAANGFNLGTNASQLGAGAAEGGGLLNSMSMTDKMAITGSMVEGVGNYMGAEAEAEAAQEAADTAYQRSKKKLQEGVDTSRPTFSLDSSVWEGNPSSPSGAGNVPQNQQPVAPGAAGQTQGYDPTTPKFQAVSYDKSLTENTGLLNR